MIDLTQSGVMVTKSLVDWLKFQLTFLPDEGPVSLKLGDSAETKEMVRLVMERDQPEKRC